MITPQQRRILEDLAQKQPDAIVARIKPSCGRRKQIVDQRLFQLEQGWVGPILPGLRRKMEGCIINEMDPHSECVFQLVNVRQALKAEDRRESRRHGDQLPAAVPPRVHTAAAAPSPADIEALIEKRVAAMEKTLEEAYKKLDEKLVAARAEGVAEGAAAERARRTRRRRRQPSDDEEPAATGDATAASAASAVEPSAD